MAITEFNKEYRWLSNFAPVQLLWEGFIFPSLEHAFVASKTDNYDIKEEIKNLPTAGDAKKFGRSLYPRPVWEMVKVHTMKDLLQRKFVQEPYRTLLLSSRKEYLVEGNYWHDNFWGDCYCKICQDIEGQNTLGKLIMEVREELYKKQIT